MKSSNNLFWIIVGALTVSIISIVAKIANIAFSLIVTSTSLLEVLIYHGVPLGILAVLLYRIVLKIAEINVEKKIILFGFGLYLILFILLFLIRNIEANTVNLDTAVETRIWLHGWKLKLEYIFVLLIFILTLLRLKKKTPRSM